MKTKHIILFTVFTLVFGMLLGAMVTHKTPPRNAYQLRLFHITSKGRDRIRIEDNGRYVGSVALDSCGAMTNLILNHNQ